MSEDRLPERASENEENAEGAAPNDSIVQSASLFLLARRILMTSLGAIALTIEETNEFIERLVERGELAEHELNALVEDVSSRGKSVLNRLPDLTLTQRNEEQLDATTLQERQNGLPEPPSKPSALGERVEGILGRLNVPSRSDIDTLTRKIDVLSGKVLLLKSKSPPQTENNPNAETTETA